MRHIPLLILLIFSAAFSWADPPLAEFDLLTKDTATDGVRRIYGIKDNNGARGVPIAGPADCDGDGFTDYAFGMIQAPALGRSGAGQVVLVFGDGTTSGTINSEFLSTGVLRLAGASTLEVAGSKLTMGDITGDGIAELIIGRQNYLASNGRIGAGAVTILHGSSDLRKWAAGAQLLDLNNLPTTPTLLTIHGAARTDRFGLWHRVGDVDGDGILDLLVAADQSDAPGVNAWVARASGNPLDMKEANRGEVWVIRGGPHLAQPGTIDLAQFGQTPLEGHLARIMPPSGAKNHHFGGTCYLADLDGNGRAEVISAATLLRSSSGIGPAGDTGSAQSGGGTQDGTVHIAWDDNFTSGIWPNEFQFFIGQGPGSFSTIDGPMSSLSNTRQHFGEEIYGGKDIDGDGNIDLFIGDIIGSPVVSPGVTRVRAGIGYLIYNASLLKDRSIDLDSKPADIQLTVIWGPTAGAIGADTVAMADFDNDGIDDLAFGSPHANVAGRSQAGTIHVIYGKQGGWPEIIDTAPGNFPPTNVVRIVEIQGAKTNDKLCYCIDVGDFDNDGRVDILVNEMQGDGPTVEYLDCGNLLAINGRYLLPAE